MPNEEIALRRQALIVREILAKEESENKARLLDLFLKTVPMEYQGFTLEDLEEGWGGHLNGMDRDDALDTFTGEKSFKTLVIYGETGLGKSSLAVLITRGIIERKGGTGLFKSSPSMLYEFSFPENKNPVKELSKPDILIIDDLGATSEAITAHQKKQLHELINLRWSNRKKTIITTNMKVNGQLGSGLGLNDWVGVSTWDRLSDEQEQIELTGNSFRQ